ncbi:MAG: hypothetical protein HUU54_04610 [Ignavibacteriaceae bacterium]|nr:hypothetical protein [Ignavibacteriaceae bacterium]
MLVQRCQWPKRENVVSYFSDENRRNTGKSYGLPIARRVMMKQSVG